MQSHMHLQLRYPFAQVVIAVSHKERRDMLSGLEALGGN